MAKDVLTREQLQEQLQRREFHLKYLRQTCADEQAIREAEKSVKMTRLRLERMEEDHENA